MAEIPDRRGSPATVSNCQYFHPTSFTRGTRSTTTMLHEQIFEVGRTAWNIAVGPDHGPPLILFHGVTRRWQTFLPLAPSLMLRHQLYVVDLPGHGRSDRLRTDYRVRDYADAAADLLRLPPFSTMQDFSLYGHSLGAMVVADLAGRFAPRVRTVIMEDPPFGTMGGNIHSTPLLSFFDGLCPFAGSQEPVQTIASRLADILLTDPQSQTTTRLGDVRDATSLRFTARCLQQLDPRALHSIVAGEWLRGFDWLSTLHQLPCPGLLLQADPAAGGMLTSTDAESAVSGAAEITRVSFAETGHLIHWQRTNELLRNIEAFLESL